MNNKYNFKLIEKKIQSYWYKKKKNITNDKYNKFYCLVMLPYPSGNLHLGHVRNYTIGDVIARFNRLLGKQVLHPIGWDAFGLPAEQAALNNNQSPKDWTMKNIKYMKKQLIRLGFSYDWDREITTCKSNYYKWEQWLFLKLYNKKIIYRKKSFVNWCIYHKTVLANEQVINNQCWRCNGQVIIKRINQWFIKITSYAKELYLGLNKLYNWPIEVKKMQRQWINPIKGILVKFKIINFYKVKEISVFMKDIELLPFITAIKLAFDHPIIDILIKYNIKIKLFIDKCINNNNYIDNLSSYNIKGINTELLVINPINNKYIPIWLINTMYFKNNSNIDILYPSYNIEDYKFSIKYNLFIKNNIIFNNKTPLFLEYKKLTSYEKQYYCKLNYNNYYISLYKAKKKIFNILLNKRIAKKNIQYKLKDWCISRQRLWGVPIPIIKNQYNKTLLKLNENDLPLKIIKNKNNNYSLISKNIIIPIKINFIETLDTFIESSWYYIRYISPNDHKIFNSYLANYWLPIDIYIGGVEHSILHLLYFRFFHKLMRDMKLINSDEPTYNLLCQGMVLSDAYYYIDENNNYHWIEQNKLNIIRDNKGKIIHLEHKKSNKRIYYYGKIKMSKSKKNGIDPQYIINKYGADALRLFILFSAPVKMNLEWNEEGIKGMQRFLHRVWNLINNHIFKKYNLIKNKNISIVKHKKLQYIVNNTINEVYIDLKIKYSFNTAIAKIFNFVNILLKFNYFSLKDWIIVNNYLKKLLIILYPFVPHITSILWSKIDKFNTINNIHWPQINKEILLTKKRKILILINNKFKKKIIVENNTTIEILKKNIFNDKQIKNFINNKKIKNILYINKKLINIIF